MAKSFFFNNGEQFSSIFNGNIPSLRIKIDISYEPESPSHITEYLQEVPIESEPTRMEERLVDDGDFQNTINKPKREKLESSLQNTDCLQPIPVESVLATSEKKKITIEDKVLKNALGKIKHKISKSLPNNSDCYEEIPVVPQPIFLKEIERQIPEESCMNNETEVNGLSQIPCINDNINDVSQIPCINDNINDISEIPWINDNINDISQIPCINDNINDISQIPWINDDINDISQTLLSKNTEYFEEIPVESESAHLVDMQTPHEDIKKIVKETNGVNQLPKTPNRGYQDIPIYSETASLEKTQGLIVDEDFKNAVNEISDTCQLPESLNQNIECLQEIPIKSKSNLVEKTKITHADLMNFVEEINGRSQEPEFLSQNAEGFQEISIKSKPILMEETQVSTEDWMNFKEEITGTSQTPEYPSQNTECFQEISSESEPILEEMRRLVLHEDFRNAVKEISSFCQIPESLYQNIECLQKVPIEPESALLEEIQIEHEDFRNVVKEFNSVSQMPVLLPQRTECFQEIHTESEPVHLEETPIPYENFRNAAKEINGTNQLFESLPQNTESSQKILAESEPDLLEKTQTLQKDFRDVVKTVEQQICISETPESTSQCEEFLPETLMVCTANIGGKKKTPVKETNYAINKRKRQMSESSFQITECLKDIVESLPKKRKYEICDASSQNTERLQDILIESEHTISQKKKRQISDKDFKNTVKKMKMEHFSDILVGSKPITPGKKKRQISDKGFKNTVKKIKSQYKPRMQITASTVEVMDDLLCHFLEILDKELHTLSRVKKYKTLTEKQLENAIKLFLPKDRCSMVIEYSRSAVKKVLKDSR